MKLLPEFQAIADEYSGIEHIVLRCQELALRVPEMSDAEVTLHWDCVNIGDWRKRVRAVLATYESRRFAPVKRVVLCRFREREPDEMGCPIICETSTCGPEYFAAGHNWLGDIFEREV